MLFYTCTQLYIVHTAVALDSTIIFKIVYSFRIDSYFILFYFCFCYTVFSIFTVIFFTHAYSCTVRSLWDLWWFGNAAKNMAPYRTHSALDYTAKRFLSYLSRARTVMKKIESFLKTKYENLNLSLISITESREKFAIGFDDLCVWISPEMSIAQLDMRHYGDAMYVSFYDRILKQQKKRKLAVIDDTSEV